MATGIITKKHQIRKTQVIFFLAVFFIIYVTSFSMLACKQDNSIQNSPYFVKLEAETALFIAGESATGQSKYSVANSKSDNITSGGKFISNLRGLNDRIVWTIQSNSNVSADFYIAVANANEGEIKVGGGNTISAKINGSSIFVFESKLSKASEYFDAWQLVKVGSVPMKKGYNFFEIEVINTLNPINVDYLGINAKNFTVLEHSHTGSWSNLTVPATCDSAGKTDRKCSDCQILYHYLTIPSIGHKYSSFHYDEESQKMMQECKHCEDKQYANAPGKKYYGEVFEKKSEFSTQRAVETVYEAENAYVCTSGGLNHGTSPIEAHPDSSGGAHVANISKLNNYIEFSVTSKKNCKADLVLVLSNVLYMPEGIGILSPMSNYVSFTVNNEYVDFSYVDFPGDEDFNYFNWRYVVMKNIDLQKGLNVFVLAPKFNRSNITMPNTDTLYFYTDEDCLNIENQKG